ncbi:hypothetical protein SynBIOSE41_03957 [Synechococcus sp. BIOS-E4-1]|uniref:hypothetical protein n=1 Tax=Synechococcus sp. BIOS-E4-1 TaxID=1400864 RepID=UPI00164865A1|nr:hypothetical protein [Synechococcus sp. BIOS-E4-1]QNI56422.1 hypothetical protein SynBIOSE41_03957 [Synechococcus sp. BIOS-E4-1]
MSVTYRGDVLELHGSTWDLPEGMPIEKAASWIEDQWIKSEMEQATAELEAEASAAVVIEEPEPEAEPQPEPEAAPPVPASIGAADAIAIHTALSKSRDEARNAACENQKILSEIREAQASVASEKAEIIRLTKTNQRLMNEAFGSYAKRLKEAQVELEMLHHKIAELKQTSGGRAP